MVNKMIRLLILLLCIPAQAINYPCKALVVNPIIDLVGLPIHLYGLNSDANAAYKDIPISWGPEVKDQPRCPREHQLLFNEVVTIVGEEDQEFHVEISHAFALTGTDPEPKAQYWTLKENVIPFDQLAELGIQPTTIPSPIDFRTGTIESANHGVVTLILPFYDSITQQTYSAGTRFVVTRETHDGSFTVSAFNKTTKNVVELTIPRNLCMTHESKSIDERRNDFVTLVRLWAHLPDGIVPFIWGGCSFDRTCQHTAYILKEIAWEGKTVRYWSCPQCNTSTHGGFDISGLIVRAAQICNIPYFFKNTRTAAQRMQALSIDETLREGDLIWIPGGLIMISDLKNNLVTATMGYMFGYGKLIELPIGKLFKGITTYQDLLDAYKTKKSLTILCNDGTAQRTVDTFSILKIDSHYQPTT